MDDAAEVVSLWYQNEEASNRGDHAAQAAIFADDIVIYPGSKGGFLEGLDAVRVDEASARKVFESFTFTSSDLRCRVHGDTAVIWGRFQYVMTPHQGEPITAQGHFSSTWARADGRWQDVLNHYST